MIGPIFFSSRSQQVWKRKLGQSHMIFVQKMRMKREEHYTVYGAILRAHGVVDRVVIFSFFFNCEKITQILEFCKYQGGKI